MDVNQSNNLELNNQIMDLSNWGDVVNKSTSRETKVDPLAGQAVLTLQAIEEGKRATLNLSNYAIEQMGLNFEESNKTNKAVVRVVSNGSTLAIIPNNGNYYVSRNGNFQSKDLYNTLVGLKGLDNSVDNRFNLQQIENTNAFELLPYQAPTTETIENVEETAQIDGTYDVNDNLIEGAYEATVVESNDVKMW